MRTPRRIGLRVALATLITVTATGCVPGALDEDDSEDVLRLALPWPPAAGYSPYSDDGVLLARLGATESLTRLDKNGTPVPALAQSWERVDSRTWRFELRPDVTFHDGSTLTAADVVRSLDAAAKASPVPSEISSVELTTTALDDDIVEVVSSVPDPALPQRLSSPNLPVLAEAAFAGRKVDPLGHGTGPFRVAEARGVQDATLAAHDGYWDGAPALSGVEVRFAPDAAARTAAFKAGEVHVAHTLGASDVGSLGADVKDVPLPRNVLLYVNGTRRAMDEVGERALVGEVVDKELLAETVFEGLADPAQGIFGPASPWAATRLALPEAPEPVVPDGPVHIATYPERAELAPVADAVAAGLREAGVEVRQTVRSYTSLEADLLSGAFDIVVGSRSYAVDTGEPVDYLLSDFACSGSYNLAHLCDPEVEAALDAMTRQPDLAGRRAGALEVEHSVLASGSVVPVVHERARHAVAPEVTGLAEDPFERALVTARTDLQ